MKGLMEYRLAGMYLELVKLVLLYILTMFYFLQIDSPEIKQHDMNILSKKEYTKIEPILQEINRKCVRIEEEDKKKNMKCFQTVIT